MSLGIMLVLDGWRAAAHRNHRVATAALLVWGRYVVIREKDMVGRYLGLICCEVAELHVGAGRRTAEVS